MRMLDYEMETIYLVKDIKYDSVDEDSTDFHIFQIHHKLNVKMSNHVCEERRTW